MAMDSIIARPTKNGRVKVLAASGCCASEVKAVDTAFPSPMAGAMLPNAIVTPAVMIETIAIRVVLSIRVSEEYPRGSEYLTSGLGVFHAARVRVAAAM